MCGIFAYTGNKTASNYLLEGLKNLEYRGYDSAGIVVFKENQHYIQKSLGKVSQLVNKVHQEKQDVSDYFSGIAHTRWATHGGVELKNCHPHHSQNQRFFLVHNGIIENYLSLKKDLESKGYQFYGDTDSEIIAKYIEDAFEKDLEFTLTKIKSTLTGAYALAVVDMQNPDTIVAIKLGSPLVIGINTGEYFLSSDSQALHGITQKYIPIDDHEMVVINKNGYTIYSPEHKEIQKQAHDSQQKSQQNDLGTFKHFMLKEIFEIPQIIQNILGGRIHFENKEIQSNSLSQLDISNIEKIEIIASGTSYNAGSIGAYLFEDWCDIPTQVHVSTEFKYKKQFIRPTTLYIFISQSGETADSLECLKMVKNKGGRTFGIVNVVGSSIARLCGHGLYTHCGVEVGVAATKSFIGQLLTLCMIALYIGNKKNLDYSLYSQHIKELEDLSENIQKVLKNGEKIQKISQKYSKYLNMFFLGRNVFYPISSEGSLKCKEITYRHTESYSAGELKHGPLSLIEENFPTILINPDHHLYEKNISSLKEISARGGKIIGIVSENALHTDLYDDIIELPQTGYFTSMFTSSVALQLFAYYMALDLNREIDKPRNLAKSVTVE